MSAGFGTWRLALSSAPRALLARLTACQAALVSSGSFPKGWGTYEKWSYSRFSPSMPRIGTKLPIGLSRNFSTSITCLQSEANLADLKTTTLILVKRLLTRIGASFGCPRGTVSKNWNHAAESERNAWGKSYGTTPKIVTRHQHAVRPVCVCIDVSGSNRSLGAQGSRMEHDASYVVPGSRSIGFHHDGVSRPNLPSRRRARTPNKYKTEARTTTLVGPPLAVQRLCDS